MNLFNALNIHPKDIIAIIGGGGKTSTMYALGEEAKNRGMKAILTTTTKIYYPRDEKLKVIIDENIISSFKCISNQLEALHQIVVAKKLTEADKLIGIDKYLIPEFFKVGADLIIIEADGSAQKSLKAPTDHEPVIPPSATVVIPIVGIDCIGKPLNHKYVHRPEIVAELLNISLDTPITPEMVAKILAGPTGYRKNLPKNCRWIPFINKIATQKDLELAHEIANRVGQKISCKILLGSTLSKDPIIEVKTY